RRHTRSYSDWSSDVCSSDLSPTDSSHRAEPLFVFQFLSGDPLEHVQEFLCDQALELAKGLLFENRTYFLLFLRCALAQNQLANQIGERRVGKELRATEWQQY